jgi:hypothetical protein
MTTKTLTKTKTNKIGQIRINRTSAIEKVLEQGRMRYKLLDDNEILKIYIGRGAELDEQSDLDYLKSNNWNNTSNPLAFDTPDIALEWLNNQN